MIPGGRLFRVDLRNLVALDAHAGHQALLTEDEGVDIVLRSGRGQRLRHAFVDHDHGGTDPDLEPVSLVELPNRLVAHEEHRIAVLLSAGLQPDRCASGVVIRDWLASPEQSAFAELTANP